MLSFDKNRFGVVASALLVSAVGGRMALAQPIDGTVGTDKAGVPRAGGGTVDAKTTGRGTTGTAQTQFIFHDPEPQTTLFSKSARTGVINPNPFTHNYVGPETHGTTGSATHSIAFANIAPPGRPAVAGIRDSITTTITPGVNGDKVSIKATLSDPFSYSDVDPGSTYPFVPQGLDTWLSINAGTHFPSTFGSAGGSGASAQDCSMRIRQRVVPGVVENAMAFWDNNAPGAIDLYDLTLSINAGHQVSAHLDFGAAGSMFQLFYADANGNAFNPANAAQVAAIEQSIASAFAGGSLSSAITNPFSVGFVPGGGVQEFSFGGQTSVEVSAYEPMPAPGSLALLAMGGLAARRRRA